METDAVAGAHNNQPTSGSDMAAETAFVAAAAATAAAVAAAVATAAMAAMTSAQMAVQMVAVVTAAHEIYINKGWKRMSWWRRRRRW